MNEELTIGQQMLELKNRGVKIKDIASAYEMNIYYAKKYMSWARAHQLVFGKRIEMKERLEKKILIENYMDWLLFLSGEAK